MTAALHGGEWSAARRPHFTPGKDAVPGLLEAWWAPGPVWTGGNPRPHRDSFPDRPARSQSLYWLSYLAHIHRNIRCHNPEDSCSIWFSILTCRFSSTGPLTKRHEYINTQIYTYNTMVQTKQERDRKGVSSDSTAYWLLSCYNKILIQRQVCDLWPKVVKLYEIRCLLDRASLW